MTTRFQVCRLSFIPDLAQCSDSCHEGGLFHYTTPEDQIIESLEDQDVAVLSLLFERRSMSLFVGYSFGQFQIFDLTDLSLTWVIPRMPVVLSNAKSTYFCSFMCFLLLRVNQTAVGGLIANPQVVFKLLINHIFRYCQMTFRTLIQSGVLFH